MNKYTAYERPFVTPGTHPLETQQYTFETPVINNICNNIVHWVLNRTTGGLVHGWPRYGKTRFIRILTKVLCSRFPRTPIVSISADWTSAPSEKDFFRMLLKEAGREYMKSHRDTVAEMRDWLTDHLIARTHRNGKVIFIVDEGQNLTDMHYQALISIYNRLERLGIALIVLLVGQHELLAVRSGYVARDQDQIFGRFMLEDIEFHGVRSLAEIRGFLKAYDELSEFPHKSGWSFTRYYLPEWYNKGKRLLCHSEALWDMVTSMRGTNCAPVMREFPMLYLTSTIENFFRLTSDLIPAKDRMPIHSEAECNLCLKTALERSGYKKALRTWDTKKEDRKGSKS